MRVVVNVIEAGRRQGDGAVYATVTLQGTRGADVTVLLGAPEGGGLDAFKVGESYTLELAPMGGAH